MTPAFVVGVDPLVLLQPRPVHKPISTDIAEVSLHPAVRLLVPGEVVRLGELLLALVTAEPLVQHPSLVQQNVFVEFVLHLEHLLAVRTLL